MEILIHVIKFDIILVTEKNPNTNPKLTQNMIYRLKDLNWCHYKQESYSI